MNSHSYIIDTHCHLIDTEAFPDVDEVIANALEAGVRKMVVACCDEKEFPAISRLCARHPGTLFPTIGIHPENMADDVDSQLDAIEQQLRQHPEVVAIGEIGIDLHWDKTRLEDQKKVLLRQLIWACELDLPVLLHIRDAMDVFIEFLHYIIKENQLPHAQRLRGILHCYSGTAEQAIEANRYGTFLIGVGGTLTYKKSIVPDVARQLGIGHIVLETDAPYLAPVPNRGKTNQPAYTALTAQALSACLGCTLEEASATTTANAEKLLRLQ